MFKRLTYLVMALIMLAPPAGAWAAPLCPSQQAMDVPMTCCAKPHGEAAVASGPCCCCPADAPCHVNPEPPVHGESLFTGPLVSLPGPDNPSSLASADQSTLRSPGPSVFIATPSPVPIYLRVASMLI